MASQQPWRLSQRYGQEQVVLQALDVLVASGTDNVLRAGYVKRKSGTAVGGFIPGLFHAQQQQPSSTAAALSSPDWATLLSRVGDELMLALLLQGAVFAPLPGGNYVQLAGAPVHTLARSQQQQQQEQQQQQAGEYVLLHDMDSCDEPATQVLGSPMALVLLGLLRHMIVRASHCPYTLLLNHHCPLPPTAVAAAAAVLPGASQGPRQGRRQAAAVVPHSQVERFVWGVVRRVVPPALLGSKRDQQVWRAAIRLLVRLRRHETLRLDRAAAGLATGSMPWLHTATPAAAAAAAGHVPAPQQHQQQQQQQHRHQQQQQQQQERRRVSAGLHVAKQAWLRCWCWWLLGRLVLPLLRNSFYITESEPYRQEVFYYRKPPAFQALRCEVLARPGLLGSSVFGLDDVARLLHPFLRRFRAAQAADPGLVPYIISADVRKAFDSVSIPRLLNLVQPLISSPCYSLLRYATVSPMLGAVRARYCTAAVPGELPGAAGAAAAAAAAVAAGGGGGAAAGAGGFLGWVRGGCRGSANTVFTDQVRPSIISGAEVWALLQQHLTGHLLRVGGGFLLQRTGIAQGSVASTLLCSLPDSVLLRLVDDWLVITTSGAAAQAVGARLVAGFPGHNVATHPDKTQANFPLALPGGATLQPNLWSSGDGSCWVRWCGLLVHATTLELMADYSRYAGSHIASSLTLNREGRPGRLLCAKLLSYMRPKMHGLLLDTSINSAAKVRLNIYQAFLLSFMKMHWAARCLLPRRHTTAAKHNHHQQRQQQQQQQGCREDPAGRTHQQQQQQQQQQQEDPRLILQAIQGAINHCVGLVRARVLLARQRLGLDVRCNVSRCHIRWLGLVAAQRVLSRKQSCYPGVLAVLRRQLASPCYSQVRVQLAAVVAPERSSVFDQVLY
ncbi:hypothetical protein OEZ85_000387 [Tetradesmus obliquus]|uniref:Telomerase reverse transcriptase n=1 Tax=Tetradesmus obliquus TaxID=3088 RepID=A0ABY8UQT2_TETOB|nr:hypothetical protein OEZ85_000387 [Tetradesmus obliquus]